MEVNINIVISSIKLNWVLKKTQSTKSGSHSLSMEQLQTLFCMTSSVRLTLLVSGSERERSSCSQIVIELS